MRKRTKESIKTTAIVFFSLLLVVAIALWFVGDYFFNILLNPEIDKSLILEINDGINDFEDNSESNLKSMLWLTENGEDVNVYSEDNLKLCSKEIENPQADHKWAIVIHGYGGESIKMCSEAYKFYNMGYSVLIPDLRGCGESEGIAVGMGWLDRLDIIKWINYITDKDSESQIVLYGVSMGGAAVMMTAGEQLPANVKAAIEDCGYTSVNDELEVLLNDIFGLPPFPVITSTDVVCFFKAGYTFEQASSIEQIKKSVTPTLFIHGDEDKFVPFEMLDKVYEAASCPKEKLVIEGAGHVGSSGTEPDLYWHTVEKFLNKYVK